MAAMILGAGVMEQGRPRATAYSWIVFALSFGLLISDYMARQVLNAVFPLLKAEWDLSDAQLGVLLTSINRSAFLGDDGQVDEDAVKAFVNGIAPQRVEQEPPSFDLGQGARTNGSYGLGDDNALLRDALAKLGVR